MYRLHATIVALCSGLLVSGSAAWSAKPNGSELAVAEHQVSLGLWAEALPKLRAAVKRNPSNTVAHYYLGYCLSALGQFTEARTEMSKTFRMDGPNGRAGKLAFQWLNPQDSIAKKEAAALAATEAFNNASQTELETNGPTNTEVLIQKPLSNEVQSTLQTIKEQIDSVKDLDRIRIRQHADRVIRELRAAGGGFTLYAQMYGYSKMDVLKWREDLEKEIANVEHSASQEPPTSLESMEKQLREDLTSEPTRRSFRLSPFGTNIYTRNYITDETSAIHTEGLLASPDRLILEPIQHSGKFVSHVLPGISADEYEMVLEKRSKPGVTERFQVHGKLLRPGVEQSGLIGENK
ncbi:MAG TPA: tetratricopeptide repeat protein [Planktothrix sp.]|jgi:hypothetical protein